MHEEASMRVLLKSERLKVFLKRINVTIRVKSTVDELQCRFSALKDSSPHNE